jgi:hypothetical protein
MLVAIRKPFFILEELSLNQRKAVKAHHHYHRVVVEDFDALWLAIALRFCHVQRHPPSHSPSFGLWSAQLP